MAQLLAAIVLGFSLWSAPAYAQCTLASPCVTAPTDLGTLGGSSAYVYGVSADGSVAVGWSDNTGGATHAFTWTAATGMVDLGTLGGSDSHAYGANGDGSVVVGSSDTAGGATHAFRWTAATGMVDLGTLGGTDSAATGVSGNGSVVVGTGLIAGNAFSHPFRWTAATGVVDLGNLGGTDSGANGVSADGLVIVGTSYTTGNAAKHAFRWTSAGMVNLGTLGGSYSYANFANGDGSVVVGNSYTPSDAGQHAFRWTAATGMVDLGTLGGYLSNADSVSADGSVVVGLAAPGPSIVDSHAFRWIAATGMVDLNMLLVNAGVDMTGITLTDAIGVSGNGQFIISRGTFSGNTRAYIVRFDDGTGAPVLQVMPATDIASSGPQDGLFSPPSFQYQLSASTGSINYSITGIPNWLTPSTYGGAVTTSPTTITFSVNSNANGYVPGTYGPTTITFANTTNGQGNATRTATLTVSPGNGPGNDNFGNARTISGQSGSTTGTNVNATLQSGEPAPYTGSGTHTVWWKWTAPLSGEVTFNTAGSNFDTVLTAYAGSAVDGLTLAAGNDDFNSTPQSSITFEAEIGFTYYIRVDGFSPSDMGNITLNWSEPQNSSTLAAAVLPYARSVQIGQTATAFGAMINGGGSTAKGCRPGVPAGFTDPFSYQTTNASNQLIGSPNTPVNIPAGATQNFVFGYTPGSVLNAVEIGMVFDCTNTVPAASVPGVNTFILSASASPTPDIVAIGVTPSGDGIVARVPFSWLLDEPGLGKKRFINSGGREHLRDLVDAWVCAHNTEINRIAGGVFSHMRRWITLKSSP